MTFKNKNSGSAIVTVLVVVLVISILATTILYIASVNFKMKKTQQRTTENFYASEVALEEIKAHLILWTSEAAETAYKHTLVNYASMTSDVRKSSYIINFTAAFKDLWDAQYHPLDGNTDYDGKVKSILMPFVSEHSNLDIDVSGTGADGLEYDILNGTIYIRGISVKYTENGYTSYISTDFAIIAPDIDFELDTDSSVGSEPNRKIYDIADSVQYIKWVKK